MLSTWPLGFRELCGGPGPCRRGQQAWARPQHLALSEGKALLGDRADSAGLFPQAHGPGEQRAGTQPGDPGAHVSSATRPPRVWQEGDSGPSQKEGDQNPPSFNTHRRTRRGRQDPGSQLVQVHQTPTESQAGEGAWCFQSPLPGSKSPRGAQASDPGPSSGFGKASAPTSGPQRVTPAPRSQGQAVLDTLRARAVPGLITHGRPKALVCRCGPPQSHPAPSSQTRRLRLRDAGAGHEGAPPASCSTSIRCDARLCPTPSCHRVLSARLCPHPLLPPRSQCPPVPPTPSCHCVLRACCLGRRCGHPGARAQLPSPPSAARAQASGSWWVPCSLPSRLLWAGSWSLKRQKSS